MNNDRKAAGPGGPDLRALAAIKARATIKLWIVTIALTELLAAIFSWVADRMDADASTLPTLMFTCATSILVSRWLVIDAGRAWSQACEGGHVRRGQRGGLATLEVAQDCPKRWLVELHAGLNPGAAVKG